MESLYGGSALVSVSFVTYGPEKSQFAVVVEG